MLRTRDFVLVFTVIVFLLAGIGSTVVGNSWFGGDSTVALQFVDPGTETYQVETDATTETTADRVAAMRQKILARGELIQLPETVTPAPVLTPEDTASTTNDTTVTQAVEQRCGYYRVYGGSWSAATITLTVVEGARIAFETTSTPTGELVQTERAAFPIRSFAAGQQNCIPSDVVGIAQDGSLIRNHEVGLYSVFDASTVIGYALDGYPIYGAGNVATDACGGAAMAYGYGYVLSGSRDTVLNCFAAPPVTL